MVWKRKDTVATEHRMRHKKIKSTSFLPDICILVCARRERLHLSTREDGIQWIGGLKYPKTLACPLPFLSSLQVYRQPCSITLKLSNTCSFPCWSSWWLTAPAADALTFRDRSDHSHALVFISLFFCFLHRFPTQWLKHCRILSRSSKLQGC